MTSTPHPSITALATSHSKSFTSVSSQPHASTAARATAYCSFFRSQNFITYNSGGTTIFATRAEMEQLMLKWLNGLESYGLGFDFKLENLRVEEFGPSCALCWITQSLNPPAGAGVERMQWENFYSFRVVPGEEGGFFEYVMNDKEIITLGEKVPGFFQRVFS